MKEERYFYDPQLKGELPEEEARHAVRVLRMGEGDEIFLMDGRGSFYRAVITTAANHHCLYRIVESLPQEPLWHGRLHLAVAPTKMNERMEWMVEKAVEIGVDEITFIHTDNSERHDIKLDRLRRIVLSAVKQSRKAWVPELKGMTPFKSLIGSIGEETRAYICHCHEGRKAHLDDVLRKAGPHEGETLVMVGPEGDFSREEVEEALKAGAVPVSLGGSRLRTETAGLVAAHIMHLNNEIRHA